MIGPLEDPGVVEATVEGRDAEELFDEVEDDSANVLLGANIDCVDGDTLVEAVFEDLVRAGEGLAVELSVESF